jgi:hypothetical protein
MGASIKSEGHSYNALNLRSSFVVQFVIVNPDTAPRRGSEFHGANFFSISLARSKVGSASRAF